ncbi:MAG: hypothetical protein F6J95_026405 [Leptolyngbya sp. SIO1E4]|nr:hypothetical protein [Leptolyngbya sp. SIO1E4]
MENKIIDSQVEKIIEDLIEGKLTRAGNRFQNCPDKEYLISMQRVWDSLIRIYGEVKGYKPRKIEILEDLYLCEWCINLQNKSIYIQVYLTTSNARIIRFDFTKGSIPQNSFD